MSFQKLIRLGLHTACLTFLVQSLQDYKYMYWPNFNYEQLFDLNEDPGEMNDLFQSVNQEHKSKLDEMRKRFTELKQLVKSDEIVTL